MERLALYPQMKKIRPCRDNNDGKKLRMQTDRNCTNLARMTKLSDIFSLGSISAWLGGRWRNLVKGRTTKANRPPILQTQVWYPVEPPIAPVDWQLRLHSQPAPSNTPCGIRGQIRGKLAGSTPHSHNDLPHGPNTPRLAFIAWDFQRTVYIAISV